MKKAFRKLRTKVAVVAINVGCLFEYDEKDGPESDHNWHHEVQYETKEHRVTCSRDLRKVAKIQVLAFVSNNLPNRVSKGRIDRAFRSARNHFFLRFTDSGSNDLLYVSWKLRR